MRYCRTLRYEPLEDRRLLATLTVTTLADTIDLADGLTSLREAIFATNLVAGPDTIEFSSKLPGIVTLTQGELRITDDLTIRHQGGLITLDALGSDPTPTMNNGDGSRIFHIDDGSSTKFIEVAIEGLSLVGGDAPLSGGAILNRENLTLSRMHIIGNSASSGDITILSNGGGIAHSLGRLVVTDSQIAKNAADFGGGIHVESGTLLINRSIIAMNSSVSGSGIYVAGGEAAVANSWITGNSAGAFSLGGGIYNSGNLRIESTTISANTASFGAGIFSRTDADDATRIINSTISGNTAFDRGGGVRNAAGLTTIEHSTLTGNQAPLGDGGGVASRGYSNTRTEVRSTIVAGNTNSDIDFVTGDVNTFVSLGHNLIGTGNAIAEFNAAGDQTEIADPLLGPLADNGGPKLPGGSTLLTHAILPGNPAINAGDLNAKTGTDGVPQFDQRGDGFPRIVNGRIDIGAYEFQEASDLNLVVDTLADESDGDFTIGNLSLREAIELSNQWPSTDTIRFDPDLTAAGPATILLKQGELKIADDVAIEGPGAGLLTIDASGNDLTPKLNDGKGTRIFNVNDGTSGRIVVTASSLRMTGGDVAANGGAVASTEALVLQQLVVEENAAVASSPLGGGIYSNGHVQIVNSRIVNNLAAGRSTSGGAIAAMGGLVLLDSVVTGNSAGRCAVYSRSSTTGGAVGNTLVQNTTISANQGLGLEVFNADRTTHVIGSTISDNTSSGGVRISTSSGGALVIRETTVSGHDSGTGLHVTGTGVIAVEVVKSLIADNTSLTTSGGGAVFSLGTAGTLTLEETAFIDNRAPSGGGAFISGNAHIVDCEFRGNVATSAVGNGGALVLSNGNYTISNCDIRNNVAGRDGGGIYASIDTARNVTLFRNNIVLNEAGDRGGGVVISASNGAASVEQSTIAQNSAAGSGGGLWVRADGQARVSVQGSTIHSNSAHVAGGGVFLVVLGLAEAVIQQSTISLNESNGSGGGIAIQALSGTAAIAHSTITENTADANTNGFGLDAGGGIFATGSGNVRLTHTISASNIGLVSGVHDFHNALMSNVQISHSLIGNNTGSGLAAAPVGMPDANGNLIGGTGVNVISLRLGPLAYHGGVVMTHAPAPNSPAINTGNPVAIAGVNNVPLYDQRGEPFTRVFGGRIDIGAVEAQPNPLAGDFTFDGAVDAADYALWRDTRGSMTDFRADGDGNGVINDADRLVWRANFGRTAESSGREALSAEMEVNRDAPPKPSFLSVENLRAAPQPSADDSLLTTGRRVAGTCTMEAASARWSALNEDLLISAVALQQACDDEPAEFSLQSPSETEETTRNRLDQRAAVLDCVFDATGDL